MANRLGPLRQMERQRSLWTRSWTDFVPPTMWMSGAIDDKLWCVDGTIIRAARCAAGGGKKGIPKNRKTMRWAAREAVFRRRSISSATATAIRSHFHLTPGQTHESQALIELLEGADVVDYDDVPMAYPVQLVGDKGYRTAWIDEYTPQPHGDSTGHSVEDQHQDRDARAVEFDDQAYRERNIDKAPRGLAEGKPAFHPASRRPLRTLPAC